MQMFPHAFFPFLPRHQYAGTLHTSGDEEPTKAILGQGGVASITPTEIDVENAVKVLRKRLLDSTISLA